MRRPGPSATSSIRPMSSIWFRIWRTTLPFLPRLHSSVSGPFSEFVKVSERLPPARSFGHSAGSAFAPPPPSR